ncbi:MAG: hypothetical protein K0B11_03680 [Mariniphaga sp.]|nr:hypothetical protein [Mariniphaga sp.]
MKKTALLGFALMFLFSCNKKDDVNDGIKQGTGKVWLSGGLAYCAEQIHLDNGDTLIVSIEEIISFNTDDSVKVKYKELGINAFCTPFIDCEIIEIKKLNK